MRSEEIWIKIWNLPESLKGEERLGLGIPCGRPGGKVDGPQIASFPNLISIGGFKFALEGLSSRRTDLSNTCDIIVYSFFTRI
jgi:hypothetical protein